MKTTACTAGPDGGRCLACVAYDAGRASVLIQWATIENMLTAFAARDEAEALLVSALTEGRAAYQRGRAAERADVLAWIRAQTPDVFRSQLGDHHTAGRYDAARAVEIAVEAGKHVAEAST